jgi:hypothetical protein
VTQTEARVESDNLLPLEKIATSFPFNSTNNMGPKARSRSASNSKSPKQELDKKEQQRRAKEFIQQQFSGKANSKKSSPVSSGKKPQKIESKKPIESSEDESSDNDDYEKALKEKERKEISARARKFVRSQTPPGRRRNKSTTPELVEPEEDESSDNDDYEALKEKERKEISARARKFVRSQTPPGRRRNKSTPELVEPEDREPRSAHKKKTASSYVADSGPFGEDEQSDDTTPLSDDDDEREIPRKRYAHTDTGGIQVDKLGRGSGYNPDEDPWWVEYVDIVSVFVIFGTFCAALYYSGAFDPSTALTLSNDSNIFDIMNWKVIMAVGFFPIFYILSTTGWLGFVFTVIATVISKIFSGDASEESKTEVVNEPKYSTSTASSRGRASSTTSSKVTASPYRRNQSTSPVRARNNSVGPARRAASDNTPPPVANTEVTSDNPAFAIANRFYLFVKYLIDNPHYLNMIFVTLCIAATYLFYKANNASYALASSGSAVVAILIQTFILLNSRKSKRQQLVYNLVQIIKQMIKKKSERNRMGYAGEYTFFISISMSHYY